MVTQVRCKRVLVVTWVFSLLLCVGEVIYYHENRENFNWEDILFLYVYPPFQIFFLGLAVTAYSVIFRAYKQAKNHRPGTLPGMRLHRQSSFKLFRKSRFVVFMLLVTTFVVFMILPDVTYVVMAKIYDIHSDVLVTSCMICYASSNLSDAFIYIFADVRVRKKWIEKMRSLCCCSCFINNSSNPDRGASRVNVDVGDQGGSGRTGGGSISVVARRVGSAFERNGGGAGGASSSVDTINCKAVETCDQQMSVHLPRKKRSALAPPSPGVLPYVFQY